MLEISKKAALKYKYQVYESIQQTLRRGHAMGLPRSLMLKPQPDYAAMKPNKLNKQDFLFIDTLRT
jgi:hypothetical protein